MPETIDDQNAYRLRELVDGLRRLGDMAIELRDEFKEPQQDIFVVWGRAPLAIKLRFVRDILPETSELQAALRQASALEDLRQRGDELETWLMNYPSLFADAFMLLAAGSEIGPQNLHAEHDHTQALGVSTLAEAQAAIDRKLADCGIEWVAAAPGEPILLDHEAVGEEQSTYPKSTIARLVRPGFRSKHKLELPAQIVRSAGPAITPGEAQTPNAVTCASPSPNISLLAVLDPRSSLGARENTGKGTGLPGADSQTPFAEPEWLRILVLRTQGCNEKAVVHLVQDLQKLVAATMTDGSISPSDDSGADITSLVEPLTPLLSMRYADSLPGVGEAWGAGLLEARDPILLWLSETLSIEPISPGRGERFDEARMTAIETRRTVHANEIETVARVERIGLMRRKLPILPAQVVRYIAGKE